MAILQQPTRPAPAKEYTCAGDVSVKGQHDDEAVCCDCDSMVASRDFMVPSGDQGFPR
jgi:hypothetical protein